MMAEKPGSNAAKWLMGLERRTAILCLAIAAIIAVALLNRIYFLFSNGGLALDQQAWAMQFYFGGITHPYLMMRDAILAWKAEPRSWAYLPGYPLLLAAFHIIGIKDLAFVRLAQAVIDSLAIFPLYFVFFRLGKSAYLAIFGCLIYAGAPWWSVGSTYLLAESLLPALVILLLAAMMLIRDHAARGVNWLLLGLFAAILPFFRSEMVLLFGPLAVWGLLVAPERKRISSAACVVAGFVLPLLLWTLRNYFVHGQFMLTPPAKWYAAWAGLGQVANSYGYFLSDNRAIELLASKGIQFFSPEAERYWSGEYLAAWASHPGHVISTILYRFFLILGSIDGHKIGAFRGASTLYAAMAFVAPVVLVWLLWLRRRADAFLIAWPMLYALASLGVLYVEPRYVRYAGLTYLMAMVAGLGCGADLLSKAWPRQWRLVQPRHILSTVGVVGVLLLAIGTTYQLVQMRKTAQAQGISDGFDIHAVLEPNFNLGNITFRPAVPTVKSSLGAAGLDLHGNIPVGHYLLIAPMDAGKGGQIIIRYRVTLKRGSVGLGVLSGDGAKWLSHRLVSGEVGTQIEGLFLSTVEAGSQFVIDAQGTEPGIDAVINKLDWTFDCRKPVNLFSLFFNRGTVKPSACL